MTAACLCKAGPIDKGERAQGPAYHFAPFKNTSLQISLNPSLLKRETYGYRPDTLVIKHTGDIGIAYSPLSKGRHRGI